MECDTSGTFVITYRVNNYEIIMINLTEIESASVWNLMCIVSTYCGLTADGSAGVLTILVTRTVPSRCKLINKIWGEKHNRI